MTNQGKQMKSAEGRTVKHGVSRLLPYAPPWLVWLSTLFVAAVGWHLWGHNIYVRPYYVLGAAGAGAFWTWLGYRLTKSAKEEVKILVLAGIALCSMFIVVTGLLSPWQPVLLSLWGGIGFTVCVGWSVRRMLLAQSEGHLVTTIGNEGKLLEILQGAKLGTPVLHETGQVTVEGEIVRGEQDREHFKPVIKAVEQLTGMRAGAGRVVFDPQDSGRVKLRFSPRDLLSGNVPWPGAEHIGESIALGVHVGVYETMDKAHVHVIGDRKKGRNLAHFLIMGMPGAGKTQGATVFMADLITRYDTTLWAHDHEKGLQTLRPFIAAGALDWVSMDPKKGRCMFDEVKKAIKARANHLGINGFSQWEEGCGLTLLVVWIEEAAALADLKVFFDIARTARSVGIVLVISLQRASHTTMSTDTRAMIGANWCFGVESAQDARFGLPEQVLQDGAEPEQMMANYPGYCFIAAPGIDREKQATKLKTYLYDESDDNAQLIDEMKRGMLHPRKMQLDEVTRKALGPAYHNRDRQECYLPGHPDFERVMGIAKEKENGNESMGTDDDSGMAQGSEDEDHDVAQDDDETESVADMKSRMASMAKEEEPDCPDVGDMRDPSRVQPKEKLSQAECRERVQSHLRGKVNAGEFFISVRELSRISPPIPRSGEWMRSEMKRLEALDDGCSVYRLTRDDEAPLGEYRIIAP